MVSSLVVIIAFYAKEWGCEPSAAPPTLPTANAGRVFVDRVFGVCSDMFLFHVLSSRRFQFSGRTRAGSTCGRHSLGNLLALAKQGECRALLTHVVQLPRILAAHAVRVLPGRADREAKAHGLPASGRRPHAGIL